MAVMSDTRQWFGVAWIVIASVVLWPVHYGSAFNVDTVNFVRHRGDSGSMFGFSVAEHKEYGKSWVLVGAPEAQTAQPGVDHGGAVYKCETTSDDACRQIPFDLSGNNNNTDGRQIDKKSYQWFGATVRSSGENGVVLACAPRYVWFTMTTTSRRDPVGTCYIAKNQFQDFSEFAPCRTRNWGYHRQGSCQAGLGADVSKDGQRLYVGAPGSWYWQGQLYAQNPNKAPEVWATSEGSPQDDDSYLGYSVASGDFDGRGTGGVAVGMPRGASLLGKVVLYTSNLTNLQNITGHQLGSYFSYSVAAVDVDGDSLDDLIVGAPLYTDLTNNEGKYETGRVYIYYNEPKYDREGYFVRFARWDFRDGTNSKSRFGLSVAALGDINKDGYGDFAVGAPYDGETNRGAVYIYHGMRKGVRETPSQVIRGEELSVPVSTFGFSISGGLDMDGNQYPDMVVGAYESDTAIFFRSRPVVKVVESKVVFDSKNKQINLEDKPCSLLDYTPVSCATIEACLRYSGPEVSDSLDFDIGIALDSKKTKSPRMFFLNDEGKFVKNDTIRLNKGQLECKSYYVYIKPNIRDKLTPLEAELRYNVITRSTSGSGRRYTRSLEPALDTTEANIRKDSISIQKNCGPDNVCIPDLRLTTKKSVSKYLLGSGEKFALDVMVENRGEDAFEAVYNLEVPQGMNFVNIERLDTDRSIPVQCSAPSAFTNNTLKCDIGNPLPKGKLVNFKVLLQPFHQEGMKPSYAFVSTVNSTNPEEEFTSTDNLQRFTVPIWVETDLSLSGSSHPAEVHYNMSHYEGNITHESQIGPQVVHIYSIRNKGPADILEAKAIFLWPSYTLAGDHLLYLLEQPETSGNIKCEWVENVNEERIELDRKRKSYLHSGGGAYAAHAAQRVGTDSSYGASAQKKTSMRKGKGKMTEEERRAMAAGGFGRGGDADYDTVEAHRQRIHQQSRVGTGGAGGGISISEDRDGSYAAGSWSAQGSGTDRVRYEENYRSGGRAGAGSGGAVHWSEEGVQGRRVGGGGYRAESASGRTDDYLYIDSRGRDRNDDSDWGTPDTDTMRRAYGGNEFRTVALDLNSNIPVLNIGSDRSSGEMVGHGGSRTYGGSSSGSGTAHGSQTYAINVAGGGTSGDTRTVHVSEGGSYAAGGTTTYDHGGSGTRDGTIATHMVHVGGGGGAGAGGSRTHEVHVSEGGSRTYAAGGSSTYDGGRTQDGTLATHMVHVGGGGGATAGGSRTHEVHVSEGGSRTYAAGGSSTYDGGRTQDGTLATHMIHVGGGGGTAAGGSRTHEVHVSEGGSRTYEVHGGSSGRGETGTQDGTIATHVVHIGGGGGTRTQTVHTSQGGSRTYEVHGTTEEDRRPETTTAGGVRTQTVHVGGGGSRTYEVHGGGYDADYERRRMEGEVTGTRTQTVHAGGTQTVHVSGGGSRTHGDYDAEYERRRLEGSRAGGTSHEVYGGTTRTYDEDLREYERRRLEEEAARGGSRGGSETTSHVSQGGSSRTYVTQGGASRTHEHGGAYDEEYDRRSEAEAAAAGGAVEGTRHYSTEYGYHVNASVRTDGDGPRVSNGSGYFIWENVSSGRGREYDRRLQEDIERQMREKADRELHEIIRKAGGGRIVDGGTSRWVVFDNGTIITAGSMQNPDYEKRVREEFQRRVQLQLEKEREERMRSGAAGGATYSHGSSYDQDYERRRLEAEAAEKARGAAGSTRHYSTEYNYRYNATQTGGDSSAQFGWGSHLSEYERRWQEDLRRRSKGKTVQELQEMLRNTGGRIIEGGAARWVIFDNGTMVSVGESEDPEYEKRLREEYLPRIRAQLQRDREQRLKNLATAAAGERATHWYSYSNESSHYGHDPEYQRRLQEEWDRRAQDAARYGSTQEHYYNRSWSSESRYTRNNKRFDPDLGIEIPDNDLSGEKNVKRSSRTRHRVHNSLEDEESEKNEEKEKRSKREHLIPRFKRMVEEGVDLKSTLKCGPTDCTKIMCTVGPLTRGQEAWVAFRGRLWAQTLKTIGQDRVIRLSSLQASQLTKLPHIGEPESAKIETQEVFTEIMPQETALKPEVAPLWIWVLSACAGTLILLLLIFLLWKLGFFKRNRPSTAPEKQPLNRNGYQAGDEAL